MTLDNFFNEILKNFSLEELLSYLDQGSCLPAVVPEIRARLSVVPDIDPTTVANLLKDISVTGE